MDPINYSALMTQLDVSPLQRGLAMRADNRRADAVVRQQQAQIEMQQAEMARKADFRARLKAAKPNDLPALMQEFPEEVETLHALSNAQNGAQRERNGRDASRLVGLLSAGHIDAAKAFLIERKAGLAAGNEQIDVTDMALEALERGDSDAALKTGIVALTAAYGNDAGGILDIYGVGRKAERDDAKLQLDREEFDERKRVNRAREGVADARLGLSREASARADRKAAGGGSGGGRGGNRKGKRGGYSNADLDALLQ